jgi:hypothetical protein
VQDQPAIAREVPHARLAREDGLDRRLGGRDIGGQPPWLVHKALAVMQGLQRQAGAQVAGMPLHDAEPASDVVQHLVAAAEGRVVCNGSKILQVDPARYHQRRGEDQLQHRQVRVLCGVVFVQEHPAAEVDAARARPRRRDEGGVAGEAPFRPGFGPVPRAGFEPRQARPAQAEAGRALGADQPARAREGRLGLGERTQRRARNRGVVQHRDGIRRRVVQRRDEACPPRDRQAACREVFAYLRIVEQSCRRAGVERAAMSAAGAAVECGGERVVGAGAGMAHQQHERRQRRAEGHAAKDSGGDLRRLLQRQVQPQRRVRRLVARHRRPAPAQQPRSEFGHKAQSHRLDRGEGQDRLALRRREPVARRRWRNEFRLELGGDQRRAARAAPIRIGRFDGHAEEAREAQRRDSRRDGLERAAHALGTDIDAEGNLNPCRLGGHFRAPQCRLEAAAPGSLPGFVQEQVERHRRVRRGPVRRVRRRFAHRRPPGLAKILVG